MIEEASINFYGITRCGYYKRGNNNQEFCGLADTLDELSTWVNGKDLGETCTYAIEDGEEGYLTYCFDITKIHPHRGIHSYHLE